MIDCHGPVPLRFRALPPVAHNPTATMFSRRLLTTARMASLRRPMQQPLRGMPLPAMMTQVRTYADALVKVPQMAESITEGTLKQWNKQVGDYVAQDEEIATIETDKASTLPPLRVPPRAPVRVCRVRAAVVSPAQLLTGRCADRCGRQRPPGRYHQGVHGQRGRHRDRRPGDRQNRTR